MSTGGLIGGIAGGVTGFFIGGPMGAVYGASLGFGVGMMIDPLSPDIPTAGIPNPDKVSMASTIGDPCPDLCGTAKITGHLLWYGNERTVPIYSEGGAATGGKGGPPEPEPQQVGNSYYMSWQLGIGKGPFNYLRAIYRGEDLVWSGDLYVPTGGMETITIEGIGSIDFYYGTDDQVANATLGSLMDDNTLNSPLRGYSWAFMNDCYIGEYPRAPTYHFVVSKIPVFPFSVLGVIQEYDCNPMHAIYYIMTEAGLSTDWLNNTDFASVASVLFDEYRGISILLGDQESVLSYIQLINDHVDNILRYGNDGEFHPVLIRDDYNADTLLVIDEDDLLDDPSMIRPSWIATTNEIKAQYTSIFNVTREKIQVGTVFGAGNGISGRLATGNQANQVYFTESATSSKLWSSVKCGGPTTLAVSADDKTYWGCGYSLWGVLGFIPVDQTVLEQGNSKYWKQLSGGNIMTYGIDTDGALWSTGANSHGQLGFGDTTTRYVFTKVGTDSDWAKVIAGKDFCLALKIDGSLWGCGYNSGGNLGLHNNTSKYYFTRIGIHPLDPPQLATGWTDVAAGNSAMYGINGGTVWTAGVNIYGQLGLGPSYPDSQYNMLQNTGLSVTSISCQGTHHCFARIGTALWGVGENTNGQLGISDLVNKDVFTVIPGFSNVKVISTGQGCSLLIDGDNHLWGCGINNFGNLGLGDKVQRSVFTQVDSNEYTDCSLGSSHSIVIRKGI